MLRHRAGEPEWMDRPGFGPRRVEDAFRLIVTTNRLFGGIRPALAFLRRESRTWERNRSCTLLDAGCGVGDVAVAMVRWARRAGYRMRIDAMDDNPHTVALARKRCSPYPEIEVHQQDITGLNGRPYDYVHASQFLHHFDDGQIPAVLRHLDGLSQRVTLVSDLRRTWPHYAAAWFFTLLQPPASRHDALLSIRKGFTLDELRSCLRKAGLKRYQLERHWFYRFLLLIGCGEGA